MEKTTPQSIQETRRMMRDAGWVLISQDMPGVYVQSVESNLPKINWREFSEEMTRMLEQFMTKEAGDASISR